MNICYILKHPGSGGSEKYFLYLAKEAEKSGHKVSFIFGEDGPFVEVIKKEGFSYEVIKMPNWWSLKSAMTIKKIIKESQIDIVHSNYLREQSLVCLAKIFGSRVRIIRAIHRADRFNKKVYLYMRLISFLTDKIIVPAEFLADRMRQSGVKKIICIHNGVENIEIDRLGVDIGYLGRLAEEKGIVDLAVKSESLRTKYLTIAGDGPSEDKIRSMKLKKVTLLGRISDPAILFKKISVLVNPSSAEVAPLSYLEAFSAGIPVVGRNIPANRELITKDRGIIIEGGPKEILIAAERLSLDNKRLEKMSKKVKEDYQKYFTVKKMWEKTEAVYKSVI